VTGDERLGQIVRDRYAALPAGEMNNLLRLAGQQFFPTDADARRFLDTQRRQQGMLQVLLDFCVNDKSTCRRCRFPELAALWTESGGS
jgi:hypothetical protein